MPEGGQAQRPAQAQAQGGTEAADTGALGRRRDPGQLLLRAGRCVQGLQGARWAAEPRPAHLRSPRAGHACSLPCLGFPGGFTGVFSSSAGSVLKGALDPT